MKYFITFFTLIVSLSSYGQVTAWHDSINCASTSTILHATVSGNVPTSAGITSDDGYSGVIPIGFNFTFYGTNYTQCVIGSNGNICFNLGSAGAYCPWPISAALLGNVSMYNSICGPWCDIYIPGGGTITYATSGTAPNRKFCVTWCHCAMFSCTTQWITTEIILYETTNVIETHTAHKTICPWNGGYAIVGVQNATGTSATVAPGRDWPATYNQTNEAWQFTPSGPTYTVASIPYAPIPYASSSVYWYDSTTGAYLGMGPTLPVAPIVGTTYRAAALGCDDTSSAYLYVPPMPGLVSPSSMIHITSMTYTQPTVCGKCDGTVQLIGLNPGQVDSILYSINGVPQPNLVTTAGADSTLYITGLCAGVYDYFYVKVGNCPSNQVGPITLAAPPLHVDLGYYINLGCRGDSVQFYSFASPTGADYVNTWDFGDGTISTATNPGHMYTSQGVYNVKLTYSTVYGCSKDTTISVDVTHPLVPGFTVDQSAVCLDVPVTFTNTSTSNNLPVYYWEFGDGTSYAGANPPPHIYPMGGNFTAVLKVTDTIGCDSSVSQPINVVSVDVRTGIHDTSVCLVDSMTLRSYVEIVGTIDSFTYTWTQSPGPDNYLGNPTIANPKFYSVGDYVYTVLVDAWPLHCQAQDTQAIHSYAPVRLSNLTADQVIPYGSSVHLNADSAVYFTWTPDNGTLDNPNINNPIATPVDSVTVYTVYGMNLFGCLDSARITIYLDHTASDFMPSAFTPDGDGRNDLFRIIGLRFQKLVDFSIYNRYGQRVFQTSSAEKGWDGTVNGVPQDLGVYNYGIIVAQPDGTQKTYKGTVTLIR